MAFVATTPTELMSGIMAAVAKAATSARNDLFRVSIQPAAQTRSNARKTVTPNTHELAAIDSALRSCRMSTKYDADGVRTTSSCIHKPSAQHQHPYPYLRARSLV